MYLPLTPSVSKILTIYIKCNSALLKADSHRSKLTGLASFLQQRSSRSLYRIPVRQHIPYSILLSKAFERIWGGGQDMTQSFVLFSSYSPGHLQAKTLQASLPLQNSHYVPLLNTGSGLQELAVQKKVYLCPNGRRNTGELESTASWGQQQFIGLENYVGFTFYTLVNSDFHEVGGVATATVISHHFCCLCQRDHLILS